MKLREYGFRNVCRSVFNDARAQLHWHGVNLESSTSDAGELETMLDLVDALSPAERTLIDQIYCDSDAKHCSVHLKKGNQATVTKILRTCAEVLFVRFGSVRSLTIRPIARHY
jgi:chromosomal replication initiation ATPase DnaA